MVRVSRRGKADPKPVAVAIFFRLSSGGVDNVAAVWCSHVLGGYTSLTAFLIAPKVDDFARSNSEDGGWRLSLKRSHPPSNCQYRRSSIGPVSADNLGV